MPNNWYGGMNACFCLCKSEFQLKFNEKTMGFILFKQNPSFLLLQGYEVNLGGFLRANLIFLQLKRRKDK